MNRASSRSHSVFTCIIESQVSEVNVDVLSPIFVQKMMNFYYFSKYIVMQFYLTILLVGISRSDSLSVCSTQFSWFGWIWEVLDS